MPVKPPPPPAKGTRHPGAGRRPGVPNRITVEVRALCDQLVNDPTYQAKLRADFRARKVHPTIEAMLWAYHLGKPTDRLDVTAALDVTGDVELRRALAALPLDELEPLLAELEEIMDRAKALSRARTAAAPQATAADEREQQTGAHDARRPPPPDVRPEHPLGRVRPD